jgi:nitric oxide reductase NorD protein
MAVEFFEDCRVETLLIREYPGLRRIFLALHPKPLETPAIPKPRPACATAWRCCRARCSIPAHGYTDADLQRFRRRVPRDHGRGRIQHEGDRRAGAVLRGQNPPPERPVRPVHFDDTVVDYRDDNRQLWKFIEDRRRGRAFDEKRKIEPGEEIRGLPPRHYPEWDYASQTYRPDWASVYERCIPAATRPTSTACSPSTARSPSG